MATGKKQILSSVSCLLPIADNRSLTMLQVGGRAIALILKRYS
ncbi:MAG: hypothetical protein ACRC32_18415 [Chroococcidiopsis sp.]